MADKVSPIRQQKHVIICYKQKITVIMWELNPTD